MRITQPLLAPPASVLAVDDQEDNLELIEEILDAAGYRVSLARDGEEALEAAERQGFDCIVLDIMMPRLDGFEVCRRLKGDPRTQFVPVIMLTALSEVADKVRGLEAGADDFLNKPVRREELLARVRSLTRIKRLRDELDSSETVIFTMVQALESKDPRSTGHTERVAAAAGATARRLGLTPHEREAAVKGGLLHDVGMLAMPEEVLRAPRPLTAEQESMFREHPVLGESILLPLRSLAASREVVRHHHERLDGSGFPDGLFGGELPVVSQVVGLANLYDDLVNAESAPPEAAGDRLREEARRGRFEAAMVEAFLETGAAVVGTRGQPAPEAWMELQPVHEVSGTVLVCDDTDSNREMFVEVLGEAGFHVVAAEDGAGLLGALEEVQPDLVLLDVRMPGLDGFEVCRRIKSDAATELLPVLLVTAYSQSGDRMRGFDAGADDFLPLPLNRLELVARVRSLLRLRMYSRDLEDHQSVVLSLAGMLEGRDPYTRGHSSRVGDLAARIGEAMSLPPEECELLRMAGLLHDLGLVGVPGAVVRKPGRLSEEEYRAVMQHPARGESLCRPLKSVQAALPIIRHHHERWDGAGYPDGLRGQHIPLGARVLGLADAFDALTSDRSHRPRLPPVEALEVLAAETDQGKWDPAVFAALRQSLGRRSPD